MTTRQDKDINVFDFDGTIISVNSFRSISAGMLRALLAKGRLFCCAKLLGWYLVRKLQLISHLKFKKKVLQIFEKSLSEAEKKKLCQKVFAEHLNGEVYDKLRNAEPCVISTACPYGYISRISIFDQYPVISALDPGGKFPDESNYRRGKLANLKSYLDEEKVSIDNLFTDSDDDSVLEEYSRHVYRVKNGRISQVK